MRGLIAIGVRQGEHVGVLMGSHPGALAVLAALSRIGAVAVMLRPDGDTPREAALARVRRIVTDPSLSERAEAARITVHGFELHERSGAGQAVPSGDPGLRVTIGSDSIDVATVRLPRWYRPDPGRVSELAFIMFTGDGEQIRMSRITNGRWVTAALGTASSAALSSSDTVYCATPAWHPSTLLMSVGGAIAGGARVAIAAEEQQQAGAFWDEVRRCGATVASYTWAMLDMLVNAPPQPGERHHPLRLFIGSGMPRGVWRRVQERFAPARVLEFYASTETGAILVNLSGAKAGAMGRRLPGAPEVRLAAYDPIADQLELGHGGFVRACRSDEPGMMLTRARRRDSVASTPLRGVFGADDAWLSTGDLFRRDSDGDYWRLDSARELILTPRGPVFAGPVRDALGDLTEVDLVAVYGLRLGRRREELAVAAVSLREDREPAPRAVTTALGGLPAGVRPDVVRVVESIPLTTWFRPMTGPLREQGLPDPGAADALPGVVPGSRWRAVPAAHRVGSPSARLGLVARRALPSQSASARIRRAVATCRFSIIRPSTVTTPEPARSASSKASITRCACSTSSRRRGEGLVAGLDLRGVDERLAVEPVGATLAAFGGEPVGVAHVVVDAVEDRAAGGPGGEHARGECGEQRAARRLGAGDVGVELGGEVVGAHHEHLEPLGGGGDLGGAQNRGRRLEHRPDPRVVRRAGLDEQLLDPMHVGRRRPTLGTTMACGPACGGGGDVVAVPLGRDPVDADRHRPAAVGARGGRRAYARACIRLGGRRDGVLQVEDQRVGGDVARLDERALVGAGHVQRGAQPPRRIRGGGRHAAPEPTGRGHPSGAATHTSSCQNGHIADRLGGLYSLHLR